jgi:site-specific recombinase XerD
MIRAGVSLPAVMTLLGHASLKMTMIYIEVD